MTFQSTCGQRNVMTDESFCDPLSRAAAWLAQDRFREKKNPGRAAAYL